MLDQADCSGRSQPCRGAWSYLHARRRGSLCSIRICRGQSQWPFQRQLQLFQELRGVCAFERLGETVGLQIRGQTTEDMVEFDFGDCGTVMLNAQKTHFDTPFRTTGWVFSCNKGATSFKGVESHAPTTKGPHKVFIEGKLAPNVLALKAILRRFNAIG